MKYAIKWKRENHPIIKEKASGLVLNNSDVSKLNEVVTFETAEKAENYIVELNPQPGVFYISNPQAD